MEIKLNVCRLSVALTVGLLLPSPPAAAQDTVIYYHTDAIGSVRATTDNSGAVLATYDYFPFGELWPTTPPPATEVRKFAGKERDTSTGLDYFGARYMRAESGRFTSVDPVMNLDAAMTDSQLWNRYSYAANRPFTMMDPDGREAGYIYLANGRMAPPITTMTPTMGALWGSTIAAGAALAGLAAAAATAITVEATAVAAALTMRPTFSTAFQTLPRVIGGTAAIQAQSSSRRDQLLSVAQNAGLRDAISNLFRAGAKIGDGSSMAAYAQERAGGVMLSPTGHGQKLVDRLGQLERLLRGQLSGADRKLAEQLVKEIKDVLR